MSVKFQDGFESIRELSKTLPCDQLVLVDLADFARDPQQYLIRAAAGRTSSLIHT